MSRTQTHDIKFIKKKYGSVHMRDVVSHTLNERELKKYMKDVCTREAFGIKI